MTFDSPILTQAMTIFSYDYKCLYFILWYNEYIIMHYLGMMILKIRKLNPKLSYKALNGSEIHYGFILNSRYTNRPNA